MVTIKDVARDAGVSVATVSCCLSGSRSVSPKTRMKILDSVEKLKYIPNSSARNLKNHSTKNIGIVLTDITETYHSNIFKGISSLLSRNEYTANLAFSNDAAYMEIRTINHFISHNVDGLMIITSMPENADFFQSAILNHEIPCVFIDRRPTRIHADFAGFDNYAAGYRLTEQLLDHGYRHIALVTGPHAFSSESDALSGYQKAYAEHGLSPDSGLIMETNMSREDAFQTALGGLKHTSPDAVITTSESISSGVLEALKIRNLSVPDDTLLLTLAEESWNQAARVPGIIYLPRSAFTLGQTAAELLLSRIRSTDQPARTRLLKDLSDAERLCLPRASRKRPSILLHPIREEPLRILAADLATPRAVQMLSESFSHQSGIPVEIKLVRHDQMLKSITEDSRQAHSQYDAYTLDVAWLPYAAQNSLTADITDYVCGGKYPQDSVFAENLQDCCYRGRYYGIPFTGGSQLMLYRRDLFESHSAARAYQKKYALSLRPPKTWDEFIHAAEFFTRKYNPDSPTLYGTSLAGSLDEELAPEILVRLWAYGGSLYDRYYRASLDTPECEAAFRNLLQTVRCVEGSPLQTSIDKTVSDFCLGKTAMLLTYSEYASSISRSMYQNMIGQVGYSILPGRNVIRSGWFLGINPYSSRPEQLFSFFTWLCQRQTSYYITIMGGQSPCMAPCRSPELLKLYPWLELTQTGFSFARTRCVPPAPNTLALPSHRMEQILCHAFRNVLDRELSIPESLKKWQPEMEALFKAYGYPKPVHTLI